MSHRHVGHECCLNYSKSHPFRQAKGSAAMGSSIEREKINPQGNLTLFAFLFILQIITNIHY